MRVGGEGGGGARRGGLASRCTGAAAACCARAPRAGPQPRLATPTCCSTSDCSVRLLRKLGPAAHTTLHGARSSNGRVQLVAAGVWRAGHAGMAAAAGAAPAPQHRNLLTHIRACEGISRVPAGELDGAGLRGRGATHLGQVRGCMPVHANAWSLRSNCNAPAPHASPAAARTGRSCGPGRPAPSWPPSEGAPFQLPGHHWAYAASQCAVRDGPHKPSPALHLSLTDSPHTGPRGPLFALLLWGRALRAVCCTPAPSPDSRPTPPQLLRSQTRPAKWRRWPSA